MMQVQEQLLPPPPQCSCQRTSFWQQKTLLLQQGHMVGKYLAFSSFPSYPIVVADDDECDNAKILTIPLRKVM